MEKSAVFIDGGYLNKILKHYFKESDIDYLKFSELICKEVGVSRLRTYYYHSLPVVRPNSKEMNVDTLICGNLFLILKDFRDLK
ncbi:MAG: hypothetical protein AABX96_03055 [Nanoarchaeota archaeon]